MAQHTESAYFTKGYLFRNEMNPALANDKNFVSIPLLGNINVGIHGTVGIKDFLYVRDGKTCLFTNPMVSASDFLGNIGEKNRMGAHVNIKLLGAGFKAFGGYNTIGINLRVNQETNVPGSLLELAKEGLTNRSYDIRDFKAHADAYAEIALGHSHQINKRLRIGGALKALIAGGNMDAYFDKAQLNFNGNDWTAITNATVETNIKGFAYKTETKERGPEGHKTLHSYVSGMDVDKAGINGWGLAFDLGGEYKLNNIWKFSASVLDLGFIRWNNNVVASTNGDRTFSLDNHTFSADDDAPNSFENEMDALGEDLAALYELQDNGDQGARTTSLAMTINLGAEYTLPLYSKLSFGVLNTNRINGAYSYSEARISANWNVWKALTIGANMVAGSYGVDFGWIINTKTKGFNAFIAMDNTFGKLAKQGIPLTRNADFTFGINIPF